MRAIDEKEEKIRRTLNALTGPVNPPRDLLSAREALLQLSVEARKKASEEEASKHHFEMLDRDRPGGLWARLSGKTRAHDRLTAKALADFQRIATAAADASALHTRIQRQVTPREEGWRSKERAILAERSTKIKAFNAELLSLADARKMLEAHPSLASEPVDKLISEAQKQRRMLDARNRGEWVGPLAQARAKQLLPSYRPG